MKSYDNEDDDDVFYHDDEVQYKPVSVHVHDFTKCWQDLGSVAEDVDADYCN